MVKGVGCGKARGQATPTYTAIPLSGRIQQKHEQTDMRPKTNAGMLTAARQQSLETTQMPTNGSLNAQV